MTATRKACAASKKCNLLKAIRHGSKSNDQVVEIVRNDSELMEYWPDYMIDIASTGSNNVCKPDRKFESIFDQILTGNLSESELEALSELINGLKENSDDE